MGSKLQAFALINSAAMLLGPAHADGTKLRDYGRHLAGECASCHRPTSANHGIVSIEGWEPDRFIATMKFYQTGERSNPVMVSVAKSLDDEQVRALALYYCSLPKPRPNHTADDVTKP